jgi:hypothetical protein
MTVSCPACRDFTMTYDDAELDALRDESPIGIEEVDGWSLRAVIEFPLREHMYAEHRMDAISLSRQRWFL